MPKRPAPPPTGYDFAPCLRAGRRRLRWRRRAAAAFGAAFWVSVGLAIAQVIQVSTAAGPLP